MFKEYDKVLPLENYDQNNNIWYEANVLLVEKDGKYEEYLDCDITDVYVSDMTDAEIEEWIDTGKAYDKAGAYAIQLEFAKHIEKIDGNYGIVVQVI